MRLNKKGITMVEIIVSVALISIVLSFLMALFVKVRATYNQSKIQSDYEILVANVIRSIGDDIENYGLREVDYISSGNKGAIILTFNSFRKTNLSERIQKVLRVYFKNNHYYVSYSYENISINGIMINESLTSEEKITSVIREIPDDVIIDSQNYIELNKDLKANGETFIKIKIPLSNSTGTIYDINIYGIATVN